MSFKDKIKKKKESAAFSVLYKTIFIETPDGAVKSADIWKVIFWGFFTRYLSKTLDGASLATLEEMIEKAASLDLPYSGQYRRFLRFVETQSPQDSVIRTGTKYYKGIQFRIGFVQPNEPTQIKNITRKPRQIKG